MSLWVKVCANTSLDDARLAVAAGADAVGLVFAPSPRQISVAEAAAIVAGLPEKIEKIGVFVETSAEEIVSTAQSCGLSGVQLHFAATRELTAVVRAQLGAEKKILRVLHFGAAGTGTADALEDPNADAVLVDARSAKAAGGTGERFDWIAASQTLFREARERGVRLIVAGGLSPENVAEAIATLQPWGVDVASGVERAPGQKDAAKVQRFLAEARRMQKN